MAGTPEEQAMSSFPAGATASPSAGGAGSGAAFGDPAGRQLIKRCRAMRKMADRRFADEKIEKEFDEIAAFFQSEKGKDDKREMIVRVNQLYPTVRLGLSGLATKTPEVVAIGRGVPANAAGANAMTAALNYNAEQEKYSPEIRDALVHALATHFGVCKWGVSAGGLMWLESAHPLSIRTDATLERFQPQRGRWMSHTFPKSVAAMRESGRYPEKTLSACMATARKENPRTELEEDATIAIITENYFWNGREQLLVTEVSGFDNPARPVETLDPRVYTQFPFAFLWFANKLKGFYPLAEPTLYMSQMRFTDVMRSKSAVHASRANVRIIVNGKLIKAKADQSAIASSEPWVITVADGDVDKAAKVLDPANLSTAIYQDGELAAARDIYQITGYGSGPREQPGNPSSPATKFAIDQQNMLARQTDREQMVKEWLVDGVFKPNARVLQSYLTVPLAMKISGSAAVIRVDHRDQLVGDFEYKFYAFNAFAKDRATLRMEARELYELMINNPLANQVKNMIQLLEAYDRTDVHEWFNPVAVQQLAPYALPPPAPGPEGMLDALTGPPGLEELPGADAIDTNLQVDETGAAQAAAPLDFAQLAMDLANQPGVAMA